MPSNQLRVALRIWVILMAAEVVHGALRTVLLAPRVGDFQARQVAVFTGSALVLAIVYACAGWLRGLTDRRLLRVGLSWVALTVAFEVGLGRLLGFSWARIRSDYDVVHGSLWPLGLMVMFLAPLVATRLQARRSARTEMVIHP